MHYPSHNQILFMHNFHLSLLLTEKYFILIFLIFSFFSIFFSILNCQILNENEIENFSEDDLQENKITQKGRKENENKNEIDMDDEIENNHDNQNFENENSKVNNNNLKKNKLNQIDDNKLKNSTRITENQRNNNKVSGLIFRIISMDCIQNEVRSNFVSTSSTSTPIITRSIELGYQTIMDAVQAINCQAIRKLGFQQISRYFSRGNNSESIDAKNILNSTSSSSSISTSSSSSTSTSTSSSISTSSSTLSSHITQIVTKNILEPIQSSMTIPVPSFGLTAAQFFGLGLPFVRHAIEIIPESCAAIICPLPAPQYRPSYRLPSKVGSHYN